MIKKTQPSNPVKTPQASLLKKSFKIFDQQKDLKVSKPKVKAILQEGLQFLRIDCLGLNVHFVSQKKICELHQEFFNDPTFTDCITLPCDQEESEHRFLGDVFICPLAAIAYTTKYGGDPYHEMTFYLMHTLLHLLGWEDTTAAKRKKMFQEQEKLMAHLKTKNLSLNPGEN